MLMKKENWIEEVMQSTRGMRPVASNPYLVSRIEAKLQQPATGRIPVSWVYTSVAAMLLLVVANISVVSINRSRRTESSNVQQLIREYGWNNDGLYSANLSNTGLDYLFSTS